METFAMSAKERDRLVVLGRVKRGELTLAKASELVGLSYRQVKRVYRRFCGEGSRGLVHRLRGRPSNRRRLAVKEQALALYASQYGDFGPTLAAEYLAKEHQIELAVETLRQWLLSAGLWRRRRQGRPHRSRRARKEHGGEMVQMDGSHHDWFEGRRGWAVLMVMIDDASGRIVAQFFEGETTVAALTTFGSYARKFGLPRCLYVDQDSIYRTDREVTQAEALAGQEARTQFGRAMQELGVRIILAGSPQAKGRVERSNGTLQDRLVKALRKKGINDLESANRYLEEEFLADFNERFTVKPAQRADVHRGLPVGVKLERVLAIHDERVVQNDWTVRWQNRWFQVSRRHRALGLAGRRITICEQLDGQMVLLHQGRTLHYQELSARPERAEAPLDLQDRIQRAKKPAYRPPPDHPWRRTGRDPRPAAAGVACSAPARYARLRSARRPGGGVT